MRVWTAGYPNSASDVNQLMIGDVGSDGAVTNTESLSFQNPNAPAQNRYKEFAAIRPEGDWILLDVENTDGPVITQQSPQNLQVIRNNGYYSNLWVANVSGTKWYQLTDFTAPPGSPGAVGMLHPMWSPDGSEIAFPETYEAPDPEHLQGFWHFYIADFSLNASGVPQLTNMRDISYPNDVFYEMQDFAPDGKSLLVQTVFPGDNAYAPSIASVDLATGPDFGHYTNLTLGAASWNEHAVYSPNGEKIAWISSIPFGSTISEYGTLPWYEYREHLHNEVFLMNANGTDVQQLTWLNDPNSPEHSTQFGDDLLPVWSPDGTSLTVQNGVPQIPITGGNSTWLLQFSGNCGG